MKTTANYRQMLSCQLRNCTEPKTPGTLPTATY